MYACCPGNAGKTLNNFVEFKKNFLQIEKKNL